MRSSRHDWPACKNCSAGSANNRLNAVWTLANKGEEFSARFLLFAEAAQHGRGDRRRVLFLDTAHHHAEMPGLDDNTDTLRLNYFLNRLGNLRRQALLNLQPA